MRTEVRSASAPSSSARSAISPRGCDDVGRSSQRVREQAAQSDPTGKDEHVAAPERQHEGHAKFTRELCRRPSVGQAVVRVNEVELALAFEAPHDASQSDAEGRGSRRPCHRTADVAREAGRPWCHRRPRLSAASAPFSTSASRAEPTASVRRRECRTSPGVPAPVGPRRARGTDVAGSGRGARERGSMVARRSRVTPVRRAAAISARFPRKARASEVPTLWFFAGRRAGGCAERPRRER